MNLTSKKVAIIGLGYVGLPLAVEFGKKQKTLGFDISESRISELKSGKDSTLEVSSEELAANEPDFLTLAFGITGASAPQTTAARTEMQLQDINNAFKNNPAINICRLKMASPQKPRWGQGGTACTSHAGAHSCSVSQRSTERGSAHGQRSLPQLCTAPRAPGRHRCSVRGQTAPGWEMGKEPRSPNK